MLGETCANFARFLITAQARHDDPFSSGLVRMINEEESVAKSQSQSIFNQQLANELRVLLKEYQQLFDKTQSGNENKTLTNIYELIILVNDVPMVKEQMDAIKKYCQLLLEANEHDTDVQRSCF